MPHSPDPLFRRLGLLLCLVAAALLEVPAAGQPLSPRQDLPSIFLVSGESAREYSRLRTGDSGHYLFCGEGELQILSRAVLSGRADKARYTLRGEIDGARPVRELTYRSQLLPSARFGGRSDGRPERAAALRRTTLRFRRGCHTVVLSLARATSAAVAVRLIWEVGAPTKRSWKAVESTFGGVPESLEVGESRTAYRRLPGGGALEVDVRGPAWMRVLARPTGQTGEMSYRLTVERKGKPYRAYLLENRPSRRARLAGRGDLEIGRANEVVFPLAEGDHRLVLRPSPGLELLLRPMTAPRREASVPGSVDPAWSGRARVSSFYDDNILRYSEKFIRRFEAGRDPGRFRVESLDDVVQRGDLSLDRTFAGFGGRRARLGFDFEHRAYLRNGIKDWSRVGAGWEQDLGLGRALRFAVSWLPDFYVRHLRDSDLTGRNRTEDPFQAFAFEKADARLELSQALGASVDARYHGGFATFRHSEAFREFDSENVFGGIRLDQRLNRFLRLSYGAELTDSGARGYDQAGETLATSDDTDPSYRQLDLMLAGRYRFLGRLPSTLFLQAEVSRREYTTDKGTALAPLHAGREDDQVRLYASWQVSLNRRYGLTIFGQSRDRSSSAPIDLDIGVEKDYEQLEVGVRVSARLGR